MERNEVLEYVREIAIRLEPLNQPYVDRVDAEDLAQFLKLSTDGDVPVFISARNLTLFASVVPVDSLSMGYLRALMHAGMPHGAAVGGSVVWDGASVAPPSLGLAPVPLMCYRPPGGFGLDTLELVVSGELERLSALSSMVERGGPYCPVDSTGRAMVHVGVDEEVTLGTVRRGLLSGHLLKTGSVLLRVLDVRHHNGCRRLLEREEELADPVRETFVRTGRFHDPDCWGRAVQVVR